MTTEKLRERYARALEQLGYRRSSERRQSKYWIYWTTDRQRTPYVFLGKAGAVRGGHTNDVLRSWTMPGHVRERLLVRAGTLNPQATLF